jgi:glycyl-tRNA synthetase beta chain
MYAKMERVCAIADALAAALKLSGEDKRLLGRAAQLCKADLTTQVVADVTKLQGVMGAEYARLSGEPKEVGDAIRDHYRPASARDDVPYTALGRCLALADKIDTIAAYFSVGSIPTGSADPYGLRREGTGVVKILCDPNPGDQRFRETVQAGLASLSLVPLIGVALDKLPSDTSETQRRDEIAAATMGFLRQRLVAYLESEPRLGGRGVRYDLVSAVLAVGFDKPGEAVRRAEVLKEFADPNRSQTMADSFNDAVIAATRVANITKGFDGAGTPADPVLFQGGADGAEQKLRDAYTTVQSKLADWRKRNPTAGMFFYYEYLFEVLSGLRQPIDDFFTNVLVMAEDPKVRNNRLALCWQVNQLFRQLADFTLIVQA